MQKSIHAACPTYMELGLTNGEVSTINGKELDREGVIHVIDYICEEVNVKTEDVLSRVKALHATNGAVTLKLFNGIISAM